MPEQPRDLMPTRMPSDSLPRLSIKAWIRAAAASVIVIACRSAMMLIIPYGLNSHQPSYGAGVPVVTGHRRVAAAQLVIGDGKEFGGAIHLRLARHAAEADADAGGGALVAEAQGAQHIRGFKLGRAAGRPGRDRDPGTFRHQIGRLDTGKAEIEVAGQPAFGVAVSTGSACSSAELEPSYVLRALGLGDERAAASIRIGLGRMTREAEVDRAAELLAAAYHQLRGRHAPMTGDNRHAGPI